MGDDARDWTPDNEADPAALFLSYCDAAFWSMVWKSRVEKLAELDGQRWPENQAAEDATARRLILNQSQGGMCICRVLGIGAGVSRECFGP